MALHHPRWRAEGLKPHRTGTFKISADPAFAVKVGSAATTALDAPDAQPDQLPVMCGMVGMLGLEAP
ncbi:hypothetical protein AB0I28_10305 [Phytomonospora sp. NPDC050363]|uniref:hypothetical protein n=1 Tax=Phytomonospora sp. NPDC050363 TaxID=3155642 RepID=UPI0033E0F96C